MILTVYEILIYINIKIRYLFLPAGKPRKLFFIMTTTDTGSVRIGSVKNQVPDPVVRTRMTKVSEPRDFFRVELFCIGTVRVTAVSCRNIPVVLFWGFHV